MRLLQTLAWTLFTTLAAFSGPAEGQVFRKAGVEFNAVRPVNVPQGKSYTVIVTQFFHHGEIHADGKNVVVCPRNQNKVVPSRVLQLGPGDYCRLAFQTVTGAAGYEIFYGGEAPAASELPAWSNADGLFLETREFNPATNVNSFEAVRTAFNAAKPIGSDYVESVHHSSNPFALAPAPFMSRYSGTMHLTTGATYGFLTSSRDCSFLLIDDKVVVEAPGVHGPAHQALRDTRKDVQLSAGPHKFEYYHAATGAEAQMVAAWEINPTNPKPQPVAIPPEVFHVAAIAHEATGPVSLRKEKMVPDFLMNLAGSVPLPDCDVPLIGVQFGDVTPRALAGNSKYLWEFGDGQTSEEASPVHIYLRPGLYTVKLTVERANKPFEMTNRVYVDQPKVTSRDRLHQLDDYLPILQRYDAKTLDAASLTQLVRAFQAKADALLAPPEEPKPATPTTPTEPETEKQREQMAAKKAEALKWVTAAVNAGRAGLVEKSAVKGNEAMQLARLVGPAARDVLGDAPLAGSLWRGAAARITEGEAQAECQVEAADVAINDLANAELGKKFLESAGAQLKGAKGPLAARLQRVWGDYYALSGDGKAARKAYSTAESLTTSSRNNVERTAWQGAHGRSTEQFIKTGEFDRAIAEIRQWQEEFPADKVNGYITLMYARYWFGREKYPQAIALAGQLSAVNADSPYIDQVLLLAADAEVAQGNVKQAIARLESLLKAYPGSPMVPTVKERLKKLKGGGGAEPEKKPSKKT